MAEQQPKTPTGEEQKPKRKLPMKTLLLVLGVVLLEGGTIAVFMAFKGGPAHAEAGGHTPIMPTVTPSQEMVEVVLVQDFRVGNYVAGRSQITVTLEVTAKVDKSKEAELVARVTKHKTEIKDTIRTLIASAEPSNLKDPKLQVVKREIKAGLEKIVGEGLLDEILLPVWRTFSQE